MARADEPERRLHVAVFPWPAFGHMIPYLELAKQIAQRGHKVSFLSTTRNIDRLIPNVTSSVSPSLRFVKLRMPLVSNLPEEAESTVDITLDKLPFLKLAFDLLQDPVAEFLKTSRPDWVFYDFAACWLPAVARDLGIHNGFFSPYIAAALAQFKPPHFSDGRSLPEDFTSPPKWVPFETRVTFQLFIVNKIFASLAEEHHGNVSDLCRFAKVLEDCDIIALRSFAEFEPEWLQLLKKLYQKPILPVGPLPPEADDDESETDTQLWITKWLDEREKGSVVYVAFGTEASPSETELTQIALGLEKANLPFFWVLRSRRGSGDHEPVELPIGFEDRTRGRGLVWRSWVNQPKILRHESVGGLLSHSGWSSVVEAIRFGKALVLLPLIYDQGLVCRVLEEKKIGYAVARDEKNGAFAGDDVAAALRLVMVDEEGRVYREKVKETKEMVGNKDRRDQYMDSFLDYLKEKAFRL